MQTATAQKAKTRPRICWAVKPSDVVANAFGYATHNRYMMDYGARYIDYDDDAPVALHIVSADYFRPIPGKINILFSMWEFLDLPPSYIKAIEQADAIIVPSTFCQTVFKQYTSKPVYICFEGVDEKQFVYHQRQKPLADKFRFLWVGAPNPRKGYPIILETIKVFEQHKGIEIYLKTTVPEINYWTMIRNFFKNWRSILHDGKKWVSLGRMLTRMPRPSLSNSVKVMGRHKNVIFDTRLLSKTDLVKLYNSAHCFVLPSLGEGWGLTLIEAMATGCPCVAPMHTGIADFFDWNTGYIIKCETRDFNLENYNVKTKGFVPDTLDCAEQMIHVFSNYKEALRKGRRASEKVRSLFTWDRSARRLAQILTEVQEKQDGSRYIS